MLIFIFIHMLPIQEICSTSNSPSDLAKFSTNKAPLAHAIRLSVPSNLLHQECKLFCFKMFIHIIQRSYTNLSLINLQNLEL